MCHAIFLPALMTDDRISRESPTQALGPAGDCCFETTELEQFNGYWTTFLQSFRNLVKTGNNCSFTK